MIKGGVVSNKKDKHALAASVGHSLDRPTERFDLTLHKQGTFFTPRLPATRLPTFTLLVYNPSIKMAPNTLSSSTIGLPLDRFF